jgi:hypothetical protein
LEGQLTYLEKALERTAAEAARSANKNLGLALNEKVWSVAANIARQMTRCWIQWLC